MSLSCTTIFQNIRKDSYITIYLNRNNVLLLTLILNYIQAKLVEINILNVTENRNQAVTKYFYSDSEVRKNGKKINLWQSHHYSLVVIFV